VYGECMSKFTLHCWCGGLYEVFGRDVQGFGNGVDGGQAGVNVALLDAVERGEAYAGAVGQLFLGKAKVFSRTPESVSEGLDAFLITVFYAG